MQINLASFFLPLLFFVLPVSANTNRCLGLYDPGLKLTRIQGEVRSDLFTDADRKQLGSVLERTKNYEDKVQSLLAPLKEFELQDMYFKIKMPNGQDKYFDVYRNENFLKDVEFIVSDSVPQSLNSARNIVKNVKFGYRSVAKVEAQALGELVALEFDSNKNVNKFYFKNPKQRDYFRAHFFGRPFSLSRKKNVIAVNTAIFKTLAETPAAVEKVERFEKDRGWAPGTAKKLGLVYFSTDVLDLKSWAFKNKFQYDDLVSAGWLRQMLRHDGRVTYMENYNDSIKIPFMDPTEKNKVAFWRTRNLQTRSNLPKYLSWPKDRSLYADEILFEELYNGWNLGTAKGKKVIVTEGEFKCAIGELATGILHLGVPGISQFSPSMLEALVKAQPSEVIVIFDRDPIGKGLVRIDEITDSQRASYFIAKKIEAAGLSVKVTSLPDSNNGKKLGIDDLILSKGAEPYLKALDSAQTADDYAKFYKIDVTLTDLSARKNTIKKALARFETANNSTLGQVTFEQRNAYKELQGYEAMVALAYQHYLGVKYPGLHKITDPSFQFESLYISDKKGDLVQSENETFALEGPLLKIGIRASDVKDCTKKSCFELNQKAQQWKKLDQSEKFKRLSIALEEIFPLEDYIFISAPRVQTKKYFKDHLLLVIRKETRSPVAIVDEF